MQDASVGRGINSDGVDPRCCHSSNLADRCAVLPDDLEDHDISADLSVERRAIKTWIATGLIDERESARYRGVTRAYVFSLCKHPGYRKVLIT